MASNTIDEFLKKIAKVESSGAKTFEHPEIESGIHKGQRAIGAFGLMPNTVDEVIDRGIDVPNADEIRSMSPKDKKKFLEAHPEIEYQIARGLASHVLEKQGGDEEKAAYAWNQGHNLSPEKIEKRGYKDSDYVQKFNKLGSKDVQSEYKKRYPLGIEDTPEGDKLKRNLSVRDMMSDHYKTSLDDKRRALEIAMRGPFSEKSEEEHKFEEENLDPLTRGLVQGGAFGSIGESIAESQASKNLFNRLKGLLGKKPMTPEEYMAKQAGNPEVQEVLKDVYKYEPEQTVSLEARNRIDNAARQIQQERELEQLKKSSQFMDMPTLPPANVETLNDVLKLGKKR